MSKHAPPKTGIPSYWLHGSILLLLAAFWLSACANRHGTADAPRPSRGIAEMRRLALGAREAVAKTTVSLDALAQASDKKVHPALPQFDKALQHLEVVSVSTRARAEAIRARGAAYFEEWKETLPKADTPAGQAITNQLSRLERQIESLRATLDGARETFKPFMPALRNLRETLDAEPNPQANNASRKAVTDAATMGRRLMQALDEVVKSLELTAAELQAATRIAP